MRISRRYEEGDIAPGDTSRMMHHRAPESRYTTCLHALETLTVFFLRWFMGFLHYGVRWGVSHRGHVVSHRVQPQRRVIWHFVLWRCYLLSYRGKRSFDYPAQGNPYNTLPPSERRDLGGVGTIYRRTLTCPIRFNTWRTREICFFRDARASVSTKETLEMGYEPVSSTTSNVEVLSTELLG